MPPSKLVREINLLRRTNRSLAKRFVRAAQEDEAAQRRARAQIPVKLVSLTPKGVVLDATNEAADLFGLERVPRGKVHPRPFKEFLDMTDPPTRTLYAQVLRNARKGAQPSSIPLAGIIRHRNKQTGALEDSYARFAVTRDGNRSIVQVRLSRMEDLLERGLVSELFDVQREISGQTDLQQSMQVLADDFSRLVPGTFVVVAFRNGAGLSLRVSRNAIEHGLNPETLAKEDPIKIGEGLIGRAFELGVSQETRDLTSLPESERARTDIDRLLKLKGSAYVPLLIARDREGNEEKIGAVGFYHSEHFPRASRVFTPNTKRMIASISDHAALTLKNLYRARYDELTELPNRATVMQHLLSLITKPLQGAAAIRVEPPGPLDLHYIDMDGFKQINDELGHERGDEVLHDVAATLKKVVDRETRLASFSAEAKKKTPPLVARYGGDEFIAVTPHLDLAHTQQLRDLARSEVQTMFRKKYGSDPAIQDLVAQGKIGVSVGTLTLRDHEASEGEERVVSTGHVSLDRATLHGKFLAKSAPHAYIKRAISIAEQQMYNQKSEKGVER